MIAELAVTIGLHLHSTHFGSEGVNNNNLGVYVVADQWVVGAYRNSLHRNSVYAGYVFETKSKLFALTVAGITGYSHTKVMVAPSVKLGNFRISGIPPVLKQPGVLHLSAEFDFS